MCWINLTADAAVVTAFQLTWQVHLDFDQLPAAILDHLVLMPRHLETVCGKAVPKLLIFCLCTVTSSKQLMQTWLAETDWQLPQCLLIQVFST